MNVCIDVQAAVAQRAGVGRYTRSLVEHLAEHRGADTASLFYFDFLRRGAPPAAPGMERRRIRWCPGRLIQSAWKTFGWPPFDWLAGPADLYHFPNFIIPPLAAGKAVVTIHDVSFLRFPSFAETRNLAFLSARLAQTVRRAEAVITDSQFSAREIAELLGVEPAKIVPIPLGVSGHLSPPPPERVAAWRRRRGLERPYLLTVGTLEPRKNHALLLRIFERLDRFDGLLVIAGMRGWKYEPILERLRQSPRAAEIRYLEYVAEEELACLYAGAELFLFPSLYEGFGLPPLEAMACGLPVLASGAGSLAEVLGEAARLIPEFDPDAWAQDVRQLLDDPAARHSLADRGRRQAARYRWTDTARQTWELYRKVAG